MAPPPLPAGGRAGCRSPPTDGAARSRERGRSEARAVGPSRAWPRSPVPTAMPGFDYKFLEKPKRRLLCPLCGKPMREPVQVSTCGHRFCDTCLQEFLRCGSRVMGQPVRGEGTAWGGTLARDTPGLCLRRGPVISGAPAVTSLGTGDIRPRGRTPRTNP